MTGKEIVRLGKRLRDFSPPVASDLSSLVNYRRTHIAIFCGAMQMVSSLSRGAEFFSSGRLKNTATIINKLKRERQMTLRSMHDIAGIRVVLNDQDSTSMLLQKEIAKAIEASSFFEKVSIKERLTLRKGTGGYRALHIHGKREGIWIEIQIRTALQHRWAQMFERFADIFGRQIRYGNPPSPGGTLSVKGANIAREDVVDQLFLLATRITSAEEGRQDGNLSRLDDEIEVFAEVFRSIPSLGNTVKPQHPTKMAEGGPGFSLVVYDRKDAQRTQMFTGQTEKLLRDWEILDQRYIGEPNIEIVMLSSSTPLALEITHGRYFSASPGFVTDHSH